MLSYETKKMDYLVSKEPPDMPSKVRTSTATRVSEEAAKAAIERKENTIQYTRKEARRSLGDTLVLETSNALRKGMPEILHEPYRVKLPDNEIKEPVHKSPEVLDGRLKGMTRAEYIRFVREECAKELAYVPRNQVEVVIEEPPKIEEPVREELVKEEPVMEEPLKEEPEQIQREEITFTPSKRRKRRQKVVTNELPIFMKDKLDETTLTADSVSDEAAPKIEEVTKKKAFLHRLWIQGIVAMCLFIGLVSFDLLNVRVGSVSIGSVKEIVGNNKTIQKIEEVVSDFAENTVLPVFGVDKKEGQ